MVNAVDPNSNPEIVRKARRARTRRPITGDVVAPIRAGMRARALVDACDRMALPAVFIDGAGRVLHVGAAARPLLSDGLAIASDHLVGASRDINGAVERAVTSALGDQPESPEITTYDAADMPVTITGLPFKDRSPFQLLRGVLVLGHRGRSVRPHLAMLRDLLAA